MKLSLIPTIVILYLLALLLSACAETSTPTGAIDNYYQALVAKDRERLLEASCTEWESSAQVELVALEEVNIQLENLLCQPTGEEGQYTLVNCTGNLRVVPGDESQTLDLSTFTYQVVKEEGEWRMCGYR